MTRAEERYDAYLDEVFSKKIDEVCDALEVHARQINLAVGGASAQSGGAVKEFQTVGPHAREKLRPILKHYAHMAHPFTVCVRDQIKHGLSPEQADRRCAVIKDLIVGNTNWRGKGKVAAPQAKYLTETRIDDATSALLLALDEVPDLDRFLGFDEIEADEDLDEVHLAVLTARRRKKLPDSAFALPDRRYPIHDEGHAKAALSRVAQHGTDEEKAMVRKKVKSRYPHLNVNMMRRRSDRVSK